MHNYGEVYVHYGVVCAYGEVMYVCSQVCVFVSVHDQVAIKIIDKTQLNPGSLQKVGFIPMGMT